MKIGLKKARFSPYVEVGASFKFLFIKIG